MALNIPENADEIDKRAKSDVQSTVASSNPFLSNSWIGGLITSIANRIFDFYQQLQIAIDETFWDTSTGDRLTRQASWFNVFQKQATKSTGTVVFSGTAGVVIPTSTEMATDDGLQFETTANGVISNNTINVTSLTSSASLATAISVNHGWSNNIIATISGANEIEYNLTTEISIIDSDTFTYTVEDTTPATATGTITANSNSIEIPVISLIEGQENNIDAGTILQLSQAISGVDNSVGVNASGISGGEDIESEDEFRSRFLEKVANPVAHFNSSDIESAALEVTGITRVFVQEITPDVGQVTVYSVKDDDENIIPSTTDLDNIKNQILTIKPANTDTNDVFVLAPTELPINFTFSSITPDTATMRTSIENQLGDFFITIDFATDISEDSYRTAIFNTVDTSTGDRLTAFALTSPVGDITVASDEIPTLGDVVFL